jgi:hypothetical protein
MWTVLTQNLVKWLDQELEWAVRPIQTQHWGQTPEKYWFDYESCEWNTPHLLNEYTN